MSHARLQRQRLCYLVGDYLMLNLGWLLFNVVRFNSLPNTWTGSFGDFLLSTPVLAGQCVIPLLVVGLYAVSGYYNHPYAKSRVDDVLNTFGVSALSALLIFFAVLINDNIPERLLNYQLLGILWLLLALPVYACRYVLTSHGKRMLKSGRLRQPAVVIGAWRGRRADVPAEFDIRAVIDHEDAGAIARAEEDVRAGRIGVVILACDKADGQRTAELLGRFLMLDCSVYMMPDIYDMLTMRTHISSVSHEPLLNITAGLSPATANLKRLGDIVVSAFALVLLAPVLAAIAVAVKCDSRGPVLYFQERIGYRRRPFNIIKFRTMRPDAESDGPQLSSESDPRITHVGAFLRKYRLDELPQFWNVLVGDMSLVGPRPEREYYLKRIAERAPYVGLTHLVRPGLSSWGMVRYGYARNVDEMLERLPYDLLYIENVSLGVDLRIMLHTINTIFTGKGL